MLLPISIQYPSLVRISCKRDSARSLARTASEQRSAVPNSMLTQGGQMGRKWFKWSQNLAFQWSILPWSPPLAPHTECQPPGEIALPVRSKGKDFSLGVMSFPGILETLLKFEFWQIFTSCCDIWPRYINMICWDVIIKLYCISLLEKVFRWLNPSRSRAW